jgi:hypothetical protein
MSCTFSRSRRLTRKFAFSRDDQLNQRQSSTDESETILVVTRSHLTQASIMVTPASISRKLRTNDPLTIEEAVIVRNAIDKPLKKLRVLDGETIRLKNRLVALCQRKKDIESFVEAHQGFLSPARRLHRDILQEIFYQCLPIAHNSVLDPNAAPLVLGRVCSLWRQIAYTTPKLWSSLHIVASPSSYRETARFQALNAWLSRSGALPLSISMAASGFRRRCGRRFLPINSQICSYMDLILTYVKQWKCIHLTLLPYDWAEFFHLVNASDLPLLEVLHLEGDLVRGRDPLSLDISPPSRKGGILFSPLLRALSLPDYSQRLLELPVQWGQVTALNLARRMLPLPEIINVLTLCSELQRCSVSISTPDPQSLQPIVDAADVPLIVLPNLRALKVIGKSNRNDNVFTFIDKIITPKLRHFAYERTVNTFPSPFVPITPDLEPSQLMNSLSSFFQRLSEPLEEFDYWSNSLTRRGMMEVLSCLSGLKRLSLKDFNVAYLSYADAEEFLSKRLLNDRFLARFIPYEYRTQYIFDQDSEGEEEEDYFTSPICLCPKLEVLKIVDAVYSERALLELLRFRSVDHHKYNVSRLHIASITFKDCENPDTIGRVKNMAKQITRLEKDTGLMVKLEYPGPIWPSIQYFVNNTSPYNGIQMGTAPLSSPNSGFIQFHL